MLNSIAAAKTILKNEIQSNYTNVHKTGKKMGIRMLSNTPRKYNIHDLKKMKKLGKKISVLTAYDYPSAKHAANANVDCILVGDSVGMVCLGYNTTQPVTMDDMLHHVKAVKRGAPDKFIVVDMPFGSYEISSEKALENAFKFIKEGNIDAIKIEGGHHIDTISKLTQNGIPTIGHIGLTPQSIGTLGGFISQGKTISKAKELFKNALDIEAAGASAIVIECVPSIVAEGITQCLKIPTIGIGAGPHTSGQVLVYHDVLGINSSYLDDKEKKPSFCKQYSNVGLTIESALKEYVNDVQNERFPTAEYSPFKMKKHEDEMKWIDLVEDVHDKNNHQSSIDWDFG